jgi:hypothetical protein
MADRRPVVRAPDDRWRLLGELLQLRRAQLGYKRRPAFTREHGINIRLVTDIENAYRPNTFLTPTLHEIARAYQVTYESVIAVLNEEAGRLAPAGAAGRPDPSSPFADPARTDLNRPWFDPLNERRVRLAARGILDPGGGQMFPDAPDDAKAWDDIADSIPVGDKVWIIADLRRRAGTGAAGSEANSHGALAA